MRSDELGVMSDKKKQPDFLITRHPSLITSVFGAGMKRQIGFRREVLLVEVERWCGDHACNARTRLALTKAEARVYTGFECASCERWNDDALSERDIPEWWEELKVASLEGLRPAAGAAGGAGEDEPGGVVARMSDAWKELEDAGELGDGAGEGGDSF